MATQYHFSSKINPFEVEMIRKTNLKFLIPIEQKPVKNGEISEISWQVDASLLSLTQLIKSGILKNNLISHLIKDLSSLEEVLEHHLLDYQHIIYALDLIYYDSIQNHFKFCYLPIDLIKNETDLVQMMYFLFIRGESTFRLETLKEMPSSPKSIANWYDNHSKSLEETSWLNRFIRKKENYIKNKPITSITKHPSNNALLMDKSNPQKFYKLFFESNVIGRDDTSNVQIFEDSISRKHSVIYKENASYYIKDLESKNGTWINGNQVKECTPIVNGDIIQLGEKEFIFIR